MSKHHRVKGWWVICLMAGWGAQPLVAAEPAVGAVSRAVEVAPPKGWTPDTPLFHDEGSVSTRDESPKAAQIPTTRRSADAVAERAVAHPVAERDASARSAHRTGSRDVVAERPSSRERRLAASASSTQKAAQKSTKARAGRPAERVVAENVSGGKVVRSGQKVAAAKASTKLSRSRVATANTAKASPAKPKAQGALDRTASSQDKKLARTGQPKRKGPAGQEERHAGAVRVTAKQSATRRHTQAQQASALKRSASSGGKHAATTKQQAQALHAKRTPNKRPGQAVAQAQRSPKQAQAGVRSNRANASTLKKG